MKIRGYTGYTYIDGCVFKGDKKISLTSKGNGNYACKMKNDDGKWKQVRLSTIQALSDITLSTDGYATIPNTDDKYFINEDGRIISFNFDKRGLEMKINYPKEKYPQVRIEYKGEIRTMGIHQLIALSYIDNDYIDKGLVCMHLDNDKNNHTLSNLKVGTYSQNNKQAYDDGLNYGNSSVT